MYWPPFVVACMPLPLHKYALLYGHGMAHAPLFMDTAYSLDPYIVLFVCYKIVQRNLCTQVESMYCLCIPYTEKLLFFFNKNTVLLFSKRGQKNV